MEKVILNKTYGYKDFIENEGKDSILNWVQNNEHLFQKNVNGENRKFYRIKNDCEIYNFVWDLKKQIIELEKIKDWKEEPIYSDFIGINYKGGYIQSHTDKNEEDYTHLRWNLILSYPLEGGHSIYDGVTNILEENMIWRCVAGKHTHASSPVFGDKPRITLSLGFLVNNSYLFI